MTLVLEKTCKLCNKVFKSPFRKTKCGTCELPPKGMSYKEKAKRRKRLMEARKVVLKYTLENMPSLQVKWASDFYAKRGYDGWVGKYDVTPLRFSIQKVKKRSQLVFKVDPRKCHIRVEGRCKRLWYWSRFGNKNYMDQPNGRPRLNMFLGVMKRVFQYNEGIRKYFPEFHVTAGKQFGNETEFTHPLRTL